jgi:hypothetical protein
MKQLGFSEKLFIFPKFLAIFGANERKSKKKGRGGEWCFVLSVGVWFVNREHSIVKLNT